MDKQKQIEEMAKDICSPCHKGKLGLCEPNKGCVVWEYAKNGVEEGYRKIPEGAVVLMRSEHQKYLAFKIIEPQVRGCLDRERELEKRLETIRKETAEKFAERVKEETDHGISAIYDSTVDEIYKEITEGKV